MAKDNLINEIANEFIVGGDPNSRCADIITFVEANWGFGIKLRPAQRVILKMLYGLPLDENEEFPIYDVVKEKVIGKFTEKTFVKWLHLNKRCNYEDTPGKQIKELVLVAGRRSGKSMISACIIGYELYKLVLLGDPAKHYGKPSQASIKVLNVAPTDEQAGVVFDVASTAIDHCPILKNRVCNRTQTYFSLFTDEDIANGKNKASLSFITGGCSSNGLRGHDAIVVCMDEMAFFISNEASKFSGEEVYKGLTPSVKGFKGDGKVICISSPKAKYGKFYRQFLAGMEEKESSSLCIQMYTAMMNPDLITSEDLKIERRRNRNGFMAEFGAEFSDSISAWVDDPDEFRSCVDPFYIKPTRGKGEVRYYAGLDLGFKNDGAALAISHDEEGIITLDYASVWFSASSDIWQAEQSIYSKCDKYKHLNRLLMEDIAKEIEDANKRFPITSGIMDSKEAYGMSEIMKKNGIDYFEAVSTSLSFNSEVYEVVKSLYTEKLLRLYEDPVLIPEVLMLEATLVDGGKTRYDVCAPARPGCHDDISEAWARSVYCCYNDVKRTIHKPTVKSPFVNSRLATVVRYNMLREGNGRTVRTGNVRRFY